MKKLLVTIIVLMMIVPLYIGIHRIIYSSDYNKVEVLENKLRKERINLIDAKIEDDKNGGYNELFLKYSETLPKSIAIKAQVEKDEIELQYLKEKVRLFKF